MMRCPDCSHFLEPDGMCAFCPFEKAEKMFKGLRRCKKCLTVIDPMDDCPCCYNEQLCGDCQMIYHVIKEANYLKEKEDGKGKGTT